MRPLNLEVLADVVDPADLRGVSVDVVLLVGGDRVLIPGPFPELVEDVQVLVCAAVALGVLDLTLQSEVAGCIRQVGGHDVPADPAIGEVIERAHPPREGERRLVRR